MLIQGYFPKEIGYDKKLRTIAENLRIKETPAEAMLWKRLKGKKFVYKFRRQHPLHGFIVDFYCYELMLVIELDGPVHDNQKEKDHLRDQELKNHGYTTLRFSNEEIFQDLPKVLKTILR